jgi:prepilin-type N-terminal cleavage/methylation domain-containing protein
MMSKVLKYTLWQRGFTLLEILVVIIIVGVLAGVAMPALFRNIERSRATEAINTMGFIHRAYLGCRVAEDPGWGDTNCKTWGFLGMDDPGTAPNSHFTYTIGTGGGTYILVAKRNAIENGDGSSDIQWWWSVAGGGTIQKISSGVYVGINF